MPALSTFASSGETTVTTFEDIKTHIIAGVGSGQRAFVINNTVDDAAGWTLIFCNNAYPQFRNNNEFTFGENGNETRIIEAGAFTLNGTSYTAAGQLGRTTYYSTSPVGTNSTGGRFRPFNLTNKVTFRNVKWEVASAGATDGDAIANGFHFGGGLSSGISDGTAADGMPMVMNGVRVFGRFGNSQMVNRRMEVVTNDTLGYGLQMELQDNSSGLTFVLGFLATPNTQYTGFQLLKYNASNVPEKAGFQVLSLSGESTIPADVNFTMRNADVSGCDMFNNRGGGNGSMVVTFIDPVGEPGRAISQVRGNIRIFRTQTFNYTGASFTGTEHLVLDNVTSGAPSWAEPANLTTNNNGTYTATLAVKQMPNNSSSFTNNYQNYEAYFPGSLTARRKVDTFTIASSGALADVNVALTPETLASGEPITTFTAAENNRIDDLDKLFRAYKTHEAAHPGLSRGYAYMIVNAQGEYEVKAHNGNAGDVNFATTSHSTYFNNTSSSTLTVYNVPANSTIGGGTGNGIRLDDLILSSGVEANFPRQTGSGQNLVTTRRLSITGAADWKGAAFSATGTDIGGGLLSFTSTDLTRSSLTSHTGAFYLVTARPGYTPGRVEARINTSDPLSVSFTILGGALQTFAETGGTKYDAMLAVSGNGGVEYDVDWSANPDVPSARILMPDKAISCETAYALFHKGLETLDGLEFVAGGGDIVNTEVLESSGAFLFMGAHTQLKRQASGNNNAALEGFAVSSSGVWVDDSNGAVVYDPGVNLSTLEADILAVKNEIVVDYDSSTNGRQNFLSAMNNLRTGHGQILSGQATIRQDVAGIEVDGIPTVADIVTGIQGADFGTAEGTQTLAQRLSTIESDVGDIPTNTYTIPVPPTASQNATAVLNALQTTDIDTGESGTQSLVGRVNAINAATSAPVETGLTQVQALQLILAVLAGRTTLNATGDQVTFKRVSSTAPDAIRVTVDEDTRTRTASTIL